MNVSVEDVQTSLAARTKMLIKQLAPCTANVKTSYVPAASISPQTDREHPTQVTRCTLVIILVTATRSPDCELVTIIHSNDIPSCFSLVCATLLPIKALVGHTGPHSLSALIAAWLSHPSLMHPAVWVPHGMT